MQIQGLCERNIGTMEEMLQLIEYGNSVRTTHQTVANDTSSRSHAICQVFEMAQKLKIILNNRLFFVILMKELKENYFWSILLVVKELKIPKVIIEREELKVLKLIKVYWH